MKYFRIHSNEKAFITGQPRGLFVSVWKLVESKSLSIYEEEKYWENRKFFEETLPIPSFYIDNNSVKAITFFKENKKGLEIEEEMSFYFEMCRKYGIKLFKTTVEEIPGKLIYEDDYQIGVMPNRIVQEIVLELDKMSVEIG